MGNAEGSPLRRLEWEEEWLDCTRCSDLVATRTRVVPGYGNPQSRLLFVGEGPGENEDIEGYPFCDRDGMLLRGSLHKWAALNEEEFFLDNTILCRATLRSGKELKNREPTAEETRNCWERLAGTIYELDPILIVALGNTALRVLTGETQAISKARGSMFHTTVPGVVTDVTYPVLATYHPNFLLRKTAQARVSNGCWTQMADDLKLAVYIYDSLRTHYFGIEAPDRHALMEQRQEHS